MLVSGFLFAYSVEKRTWTETLMNRLTVIVMPVMLWSFVPFGIDILKQLHANQSVSLWYIMQKYIFTALGNLWFLWAIFWCSTAVTIVKQFFKDSKWVYLAGFLLTFIIPDVPDVIGLHLHKYMYPFFIAGYFYNKNGYASKLEKVYTNNMVLLLIAAIFAVLLLFYNRDSYIYTTEYYLFRGTPLKQLGIDLYRCAIGFAGSAFILLVLLKIYPLFSDTVKKTIGYIGANTLGIYIVSNYLFSYVIVKLTASLPQINYAIMMMEAVFVLAVSPLITCWIRKNYLLNKLLFGGRA